jgi:hypothetical protein
MPPRHVIVDGSNLATEGRTHPSLAQLNDALAAYRADHPDALITVVVDATFGHRIDPKEVAAFEKAIDSNEFVAPPAGALGRGDGFILSIARKANAAILSNDSYQEFHGENPWLFDEGRLIGGKPVPHVGWVFVERSPVRGPLSRRSIREGKAIEKSAGRRRSKKDAAETVVVGSADANAPMPVPKAPPPGAVMKGAAAPKPAPGKSPAAPAPTSIPATAPSAPTPSKPAGGGQPKPSTPTNDLLPFLSFVEHFPVGTAVTGVVESYSSHGAYVSIGDVHGYVPLRLMSDPPPRSAREAMSLGESVTLVVTAFAAARRSVDLAVPPMGPAISAPPAKKGRGKRAVPAPDLDVIAEALATAPDAPALPIEPAADAAPSKAAKKASRPRKSAAPASPAPSAPAPSPEPATASAAPEATDPAPAPAPAPKVRSPKAAAPKKAAAAAPRARKAATAAAPPAPEPAAELPAGPPAKKASSPRKRAAKAAEPK